MTVIEMERIREYKEEMRTLMQKIGKGEPSMQTRTYLDTLRAYTIGYIDILKTEEEVSKCRKSTE